MGNFLQHRDLLIPFVTKLTSGRFIFTVVCAGVFAYTSITGVLKEDKMMEILLIVVYAYFNRREPTTTTIDPNDVDEGAGNDGVTTTTTTKK